MNRESRRRRRRVPRSLPRRRWRKIPGASRSILWRFGVGIAQNADLINKIFDSWVAMEQGQRIVAVQRRELREKSYRFRTAGLCAAERLWLDETMEGLMIVGLMAVWECAEENVLDEDERECVFLALYWEFLKITSMIMPVNVHLDMSAPLHAHRNFRIETLDDGFCWNSLRWRKQGLLDLFALSRLDALVTLNNGHVLSGELVLVIGMFAWTYPRCQQDIAKLFRESGQPIISRIVSYFICHMLHHFVHLIQSDEREALSMWTPAVDYFVECVQGKGGEYGVRFDRVGMFLDGTFNHTCRPEQREEHDAQGRDTQRAVYSGYYGGWGLKYLHCVFPNGIIGQLWGPVDGRRHDAHLFAISGINDKLARLSQLSGSIIHGKAFFLHVDTLIFFLAGHGDSAFPATSHMRKGGGWEWGRRRICVEWTIGKVCQQGASLDMSAHMQVKIHCVLCVCVCLRDYREVS